MYRLPLNPLNFAQLSYPNKPYPYAYDGLCLLVAGAATICTCLAGFMIAVEFLSFV